MASPTIAETQGLTKIYGDRVIALAGVDLRISQGSVYGLVGPNGAGKTTLLRLLIGLQRPTSGSTRLFGEEMSPERSDLRRRIGFLATNPRFPKSDTAIQYLRFVGNVSGLTRDEREARVATLLRDLDLLAAAGQRIGTFSTGMNTRLGIAASFINDPDLIMWDEPTSGLDPVGRRQVIDLIRETGGRKTVLVSTHVLGDVERVCDDVGLLYRGRLIYQGPIEEMKRMTGARQVELEIDGDTSRLLQRVAGWEPKLLAVSDPPFLRVTIPESLPLGPTLSQLLLAAEREGLSVLAVNMMGDPLEEAFLERLDEDRRRGPTSKWGTDP